MQRSNILCIQPESIEIDFTPLQRRHQHLFGGHNVPRPGQHRLYKSSNATRSRNPELAAFQSAARKNKSAELNVSSDPEVAPRHVAAPTQNWPKNIKSDASCGLMEATLGPQFVCICALSRTIRDKSFPAIRLEVSGIDRPKRKPAAGKRVEGAWTAVPANQQRAGAGDACCRHRERQSLLIMKSVPNKRDGGLVDLGGSLPWWWWGGVRNELGRK